MSHFTDIQLQFKNKNILLEALVEMGWRMECIEVHDTPANLYGYQGDMRQDTANIIIRRKNVGAMSNDIGFRLNPDGTYTAIISEYDQGHRGKGRYGTEWLGRLKQTYGAKEAERTLKLKGIPYTKSKLDNGTIRLIAIKR